MLRNECNYKFDFHPEAAGGLYGCRIIVALGWLTINERRYTMEEFDVGALFWLSIAAIAFGFFVIMTSPYGGAINLPLNL
jgi:hypothetical protein